MREWLRWRVTDCEGDLGIPDSRIYVKRPRLGLDGTMKFPAPLSTSFFAAAAHTPSVPESSTLVPSASMSAQAFARVGPTAAAGPESRSPPVMPAPRSHVNAFDVSDALLVSPMGGLDSDFKPRRAAVSMFASLADLQGCSIMSRCL